jgi:hypothetical protein
LLELPELLNCIPVLFDALRDEHFSEKLPLLFDALGDEHFSEKLPLLFDALGDEHFNSRFDLMLAGTSILPPVFI